MDKINLQQELKNKWKMFVKHEWASTEPENSLLIKSWKRCIRRCDPWQWEKPNKASGHTFDLILERKQDFIRLTKRVVEDNYTLSYNKDIAFFILDENGWVLSHYAWGDVSERLSALGFGEGSYWGEEQIGTNVWSLCAEYNLFTILRGAEHYCEALHDFAMSAAPVVDYYGVLHGYIVYVEHVNATESALYLSHSAANELLNLIYIKKELFNTNKLLCQHNAIIECMDDGFICWDGSMTITMINPQAEKLLGIKKDSVIGKSIKDHFVFPPVVVNSIENRIKFSQKQIVLDCNGEFIELLITLRPLSDGTFLLFIHPLDKIRKIAQQQINTNANFTFDRLYAVSKNMKQIVLTARRALKTRSPILICGEEGVGKLSMAMAIHNESDGMAGPFISIDCQMLSPDNMARELLGSDEGPILSKFELAHNGTLYLDKIEYLSSELQSSLLKVLKTGLIMRSDSPRLIPVNFLLIACTSSTLREYVQHGAFSRQLYYEISMTELEIPPLRRRKDDLHFMIADLLEKYKSRTSRKLIISDEAAAALQEYSWPGNISEFKNRMEKIFLSCTDNVLDISDVPMDIRSNKNGYDEGEMKILSMEEVEMQAIETACRLYDWNLSKVANVLKIGRTTLWRKMKAYNMHKNIDAEIA